MSSCPRTALLEGGVTIPSAVAEAPLFVRKNGPTQFDFPGTGGGNHESRILTSDWCGPIQIKCTILVIPT